MELTPNKNMTDVLAATKEGNAVSSGRIVWVDAMKGVGMYFIVLGHMFPKGLEFIYAFSVPLFFLLSGFTTSRKQTDESAVTGVVIRLGLPMVVYAALACLWTIASDSLWEDLTPGDAIDWAMDILLGFQGQWGG